MAAESHEIGQIVCRYHQAIADKDLKVTLGCVAPGYFGDAKATEAMHRRIERAFKSRKTSYANRVEVVHTTVAKAAGLALVVTRETGSSMWLNGRKLEWRRATNLWCLTRVRGKWKIVRSLHNIGKRGAAAGS